MTPAGWARSIASLAEGRTRFYCVTRAARWQRLAATALSDDVEWALAWVARWRAAGKSIPRRIGMFCARSRRRHKQRNDPKMRVRERDLWKVLANFGARPRVSP